ncbi:MAG TPA: bifunctional DNA primase/polymerase, partial [Pyrinomonadaceae bacterium]
MTNLNEAPLNSTNANFITTDDSSGFPNRDFASDVLDLIKRGFSVFPICGVRDDGSSACYRGAHCADTGKHPIEKGWQQKLITDEVTAWRVFHGKSAVNVGIATGEQSGFFVVDEDIAKGGNIADLGIVFAETLTAKTGGGKHYFFRYPNDIIIKNSEGDLSDNVDVRGDSGFVVAPPSRHHNGKHYEFLNPNSEIAEAPIELLKLILERSKGSRDATLKRFGQSAFDKYGIRFTDAGKNDASFYAKAPQGQRFDDEIPEGKRNRTLFRLACRMVGDGFADETICTQIAITNDERCNPPLENEELETIVKSALEYEKGDRIWQKIERDESEPNEGKNADDVTNSDLFQSWNDLSNTTFAPFEYIIFGLERLDIGMISAVTNCGKSSLLRNLAISLSAGLPYLSLCDEGTPRRILLCDYETSPTRFQRDLVKMTSALSNDQKKLVGENLRTYLAKGNADFYLNLTDRKCFERLKSAAEEFQPDLIIIDTMTAGFALKNENDNAEVSNGVIKPLLRLAASSNAAVIFSHHIGKSGLEYGAASNGIHRARGASTLGSACQTTYELDTKKTTHGGTTVVLSFPKVKDETPADLPLKLNSGTRWFEVADAVMAYDNADENYFRLMAIITEPIKKAEIVEKSADFISKATA